MSQIEAPQSVIDALDARFQERRAQVPVLRQRAEAEGVTKIQALEDIVPVLFPHTVYKSYPASLVDNGKWPMMNRWLSSVSTRPITTDVAGVTDVDSWLARLVEDGHYVSSSSGTSGKSSFLDKSKADLEAVAKNHFEILTEAGVAPDHGWHIASFGPPSRNAVGNHMGEVLGKAFARPDNMPRYPAAPQSEGQQAYMARMIRIRRALTEGTATPDELTSLKEEQDRRQVESEKTLEFGVDQLLARRSEKMLFATMMATAWRLVEALRARGVKPGDITGENAIYMAGGTKGVDLPPGHVEEILAMLNVDTRRFQQLYSMQEINMAMGRCVEGRYHVPDELVLLVLDEPGEALAPTIEGKVKGRAAFFDLTVDARWGGIISGDYIHADFSSCPCGQPGATVFPDITRYLNRVDGDKITCAGTMDAYVRGFIDT